MMGEKIDAEKGLTVKTVT